MICNLTLFVKKGHIRPILCLKKLFQNYNILKYWLLFLWTTFVLIFFVDLYLVVIFFRFKYKYILCFQGILKGAEKSTDVEKKGNELLKSYKYWRRKCGNTLFRHHPNLVSLHPLIKLRTNHCKKYGSF